MLWRAAVDFRRPHQRGPGRRRKPRAVQTEDGQGWL